MNYIESILHKHPSPSSPHQEFSFSPQEIHLTRLIMVGTMLFHALPPEEQLLMEVHFRDHDISNLNTLPPFRVISIAAALDYDSRSRGQETDFLTWATAKLTSSPPLD